MPAVRLQFSLVWTCPLPTTLTSFRATPDLLYSPLKACLRPSQKKPPLILELPPFSYWRPTSRGTLRNARGVSARRPARSRPRPGVLCVWIKIWVVPVLNQRDVKKGKGVRLAKRDVGGVARLSRKPGRSRSLARFPDTAEIICPVRNKRSLHRLNRSRRAKVPFGLGILEGDRL